VLKTRVITAVVILLVLVGMVFYASRALWSLFMLAVALLGCWEWSRMSGLSQGAQSAYLALSGMIGAVLWLLCTFASGMPFLATALVTVGVATLFWVFGATTWLARRLRPPPLVCAIAGWIVVWPTWFAFVVLRDASPWLLLATAAVVWVADIAAYFAGRRFGKRKLAPAISPGKSWEGVYGALVGVAVYGVVLCFVAGKSSTPLAAVFAPGACIPAIVAMLGLAALSVVGDLFESWMKRGAGLKDSSSLLPGHGGILDRIDALTSTLPVAALALMIREALTT
jgi:phosphatidate cytidylyltransferase